MIPTLFHLIVSSQSSCFLGYQHKSIVDSYLLFEANFHLAVKSLWCLNFSCTSLAIPSFVISWCLFFSLRSKYRYAPRVSPWSWPVFLSALTPLLISDSLFILNIISISSLNLFSGIQNWASTVFLICSSECWTLIWNLTYSKLSSRWDPYKTSSFLGIHHFGNGNSILLVAYAEPWSLIWAISFSCTPHLLPRQIRNISSSHCLHCCHLSPSYHCFYLRYCSNHLRVFILFRFVFVCLLFLGYPTVSEHHNRVFLPLLCFVLLLGFHLFSALHLFQGKMCSFSCWQSSGWFDFPYFLHILC